MWLLTISDFIWHVENSLSCSKRACYGLLGKVRPLPSSLRCHWQGWDGHQGCPIHCRQDRDTKHSLCQQTVANQGWCNRWFQQNMTMPLQFLLLLFALITSSLLWQTVVCCKKNPSSGKSALLSGKVHKSKLFATGREKVHLLPVTSSRRHLPSSHPNLKEDNKCTFSGSKYIFCNSTFKGESTITVYPSKIYRWEWNTVSEDGRRYGKL